MRENIFNLSNIDDLPDYIANTLNKKKTIKTNTVAIKPHYILTYKGMQLNYRDSSFGKQMIWKTKKTAQRFIEEQEFDIDKKHIKIKEMRII